MSTADGPTVRLALQIQLLYEVGPQGADFVFNIQPAYTLRQRVSDEVMTISQGVTPWMHTDPATATRWLRLHAEPGELRVSYQATVELLHHRADPARLDEVAIHRLPPQALAYIYPSRYCQSDRLMRLAMHEFGHLAPGYARVQAVRDWVCSHVVFTSNSSNASTSAVDTVIERVGVCRDFTHLMIALCRALNIPARFTSGTDYGADPILGPHDFHAYVEVYVGDGWYIFDASGTAIPMGLVRLGTGRDAADVAFATIFGSVSSAPPLISTEAWVDAAQGTVLPQHGNDALSTDRWG